MQRTLTIAFSLLTMILILPAPGLAEEADTLRGSVWDLVGNEEPSDAQVQEVQAAAETAGAEKLAAVLAEGRVYKSDLPTGWLERSNKCSDGVERGYLLYVPADYTPEKKYRLLVDMHGGVSRRVMLSYAELEQMKFFWGEHAEQNGYLLAIPAGQKDAEWWNPVGAQGVLDLIRRVRREHNVDENQVLATGFSDGGSGSYYLALAHSTPFAAFIPLNGHVGVAGARGLQVHLRNLINKPVYAVNTENDSLYPSKALKPVAEAIQGLGAPFIWRDIPGFRHEPTYLPQERPAIASWMEKTQRTPHPKSVVWEGAADRPGRMHWLEVRRVEDVGNNAAIVDVNPKMAPGRVLLGIQVDQGFDGSGAKVTVVNEGSPAASAQVKVGDVIVRFDEIEIAGLGDLRKALAAKKFGDKFALEVLRGTDKQPLSGAFATAKPQPAFSREKTWGSLRATVSGNTIDVQATRIAAFDVYLSPKLVDLGKPVIVKVNGEVLHEAIVKPDVSFMLEQARKDEDRSLVYWARLPLLVAPKKSAPAGD